jgi:tRNA A-37 threonylcarbamoyl transferase component Bud32
MTRLQAIHEKTFTTNGTCQSGLRGVSCLRSMQEMKDTARATVRIGYDGRVHKTFRGHQARERFEHEVRVLRYLEQRGCNFVPRLLEADAEALKIVTSNCGSRVDQVNDERQKELFAELETYGVRHEDAEVRNITYRTSDGRFCLIDFEFATILDDGTGRAISLKPSG